MSLIMTIKSINNNDEEGLWTNPAGGFGIRGLMSFNQSLLGKWLVLSQRKAVERESVVNRMTGVWRQVGVVMVIPVEVY